MKKWLFIAVGVAVAAFALYSLALSRAVTGFAAPGPSPVEKKIEAAGEAKTQQVEKQAERDKEEIDNASGTDLLDLARERLFPK